MESEKNLSNENTPKINNSVFSYYGYAWGKLWKYFLELLLITIVSTLVFLPALGLDNDGSNIFSERFFSIDLFFVSFEGFGAYIILAIAYVLLFQWPLEYGISYVNLKAARGEKFQVKNMFDVFDNYWNAVFANLLVVTIIGFGFMLLFVPAIIFACKLAFVPYLIVDKKMDAVEAVKTSWEITNGYTWQIFLIGFLAFFIFFLGLLAFGVGVIISLIWIRLTFASIYLSVSQKIDSDTISP
jgi:hypothetical protein